MYQNLSHHDNQFIVSIARTIDEVEEMRESWESMQPYPIANIDYFLTLLKFRKNVVKPYVILITRNEIPEAIAVGRIENIIKTLKLKNRIIYLSKVKAIFFDIECLVGNLSIENSTIIITEAYKSLKKKEADVVAFSEVSTDSNVYKLSRAIPGFLFRDYFPKIQGHYKMTLPLSSNEFYKARKKAKNLRRIKNRLHREFEGNIEVNCFRDLEDVDRLCRDAEKISRKTYQFAAGDGIVNNVETRKKLSELAKKGWFLAYILYINNEPCAFEGGIYFDRTYYADYCGYNAEYRKYEIGTYLELNIIETLCEDPECQYYDFGWMDTFHKNRYCDVVIEEASFHIYRPSLKGLFLNFNKVLFGIICMIGRLV